MKEKFRIPLSYNAIPSERISAMLQSYSHRHHDDLIADFENELCSLTGAKHAVALHAGTAAIHLGLKALGVTTGDVVLASSFTYVASINPILYLSAVPFFIDSNADDWNMDPNLLEEAILQCVRKKRQPKAILVVHTYGMPANMKTIKAISARHQIPILEDAAEALGSTYEGKPLGTLSEAGIFSFNNNKLITTYGGGALLTNNSSIAAKANLWASQSRDNLPFYEHREIGYNYKMGALSAATGLAQLGFLKAKVDHRRKTHDAYRKILNDKVEWQLEGKDSISNRWITTIKLPQGVKSEALQRLLAEKEIETRPLWKPMHLQPVFKDFEARVNGCSEKLFTQGLCLPSGDGLGEEQVNEIAGHILNYLTR